MTEDTELLRRFAEEKSEASFAELVQRHVNFVYACALRRVGGDTHLAEDVTQQVFTALARNAAKRPDVLSAWLFTTTRNLSAHVVRGERRRHVREQEAHLMDELTSSPTHDAEWEKLRPVLDEALDDLNDDDRQAVLLRFTEGKSFAEVGARLRLAENSARMRVERALEKMHAGLTRRGVTSTASALSLALANQTGMAAPAGLAASITGVALASMAGLGTVGLFTFMSTSKIVMGAVGLCACAAIGTALFEAKALKETKAELADVVRERADLQTKLRGLDGRLMDETKRAAAADEDTAKLLAAVGNVVAAQTTPSPSVPVTHDGVQARYRHGQELARNGDTAGALKEYLWCFDEGMSRIASFTGVRRSFLLSSIAQLGATEPAAIAALRDRRDAAEQRLLTGKADFDAGADFSSINHYLKEDASTLQFFDQLPAGDERRKGFGATIYDLLVGAQRYQDALQVTSYASMSSSFEMAQNLSVPATISNPELIKKANHDYAVTTATRNIEVLAGAGDVAHAKALVNRLLAYDGSEETKATLQTHLARAGRSDLLTAPAK